MLSRQFEVVYNDVPDLTFFRACCNLSGQPERVPFGKRNGSIVPILGPDWTDAGHNPPVSEHWADQPKFYVNLNPTEQRTWRKILLAVPIAQIAAEEGVSRPAIYSRIEGTHGHGGMIAKNFWVLLWWLCRRRLRIKN